MCISKKHFLLQTVSLNLNMSQTRCRYWTFACISLVFNYRIQSTEEQEKCILAYANAHTYTHNRRPLPQTCTHANTGEKENCILLQEHPAQDGRSATCMQFRGLTKSTFPSIDLAVLSFMINISHQHYITAARSSKLPFPNIYVLKNPTAHSE